MSDLPILAHAAQPPPDWRIPREASRGLARNGPKSSRVSLLSECSRENLKSIFLARRLWREPGKPGPEAAPLPFIFRLFNGAAPAAGALEDTVARLPRSFDEDERTTRTMTWNRRTWEDA